MKNSSASPISPTVFSAQRLPDGSCMVRRSAQEIEIWGANISEHYTIRVEARDETKMDVIYLGFIPSSLKH